MIAQFRFMIIYELQEHFDGIIIFTFIGVVLYVFKYLKRFLIVYKFVEIDMK